MFQARLSSRLAGRLPRVAQASFHQTAPVYVKVGDSIPDLDALVENSPGNKVNLSKELTGKGLIIGVPAAFSTSIPEFRSPDFKSSESHYHFFRWQSSQSIPIKQNCHFDHASPRSPNLASSYSKYFMSMLAAFPGYFMEPYYSPDIHSFTASSASRLTPRASLDKPLTRP